MRDGTARPMRDDAESLPTNRPSGEAASTDRPKSGRWKVIEQFEYEGFQYRVSRKPVAPPSDKPQLTNREKEALEYARRGYNNKLIANMLGIAPSTVGVLLFRAAAKVGAKSRSELLRAYQRLEKGKE